MRGEVIWTQADEILERGIKMGIEQGREEGQRNAAGLMNFLWSHGHGDEAIKAGSDEAYLNRLLNDYANGTLTLHQ